MSSNLIVYSARLCSDCQALKQWMDSKNIKYITRDIRESKQYSHELITATGKEGVPFLLVNGEWVRGYQVGKMFDPEWCENLFIKLKLI